MIVYNLMSQILKRFTVLVEVRRIETYRNELADLLFDRHSL